MSARAFAVGVLVAALVFALLGQFSAEPEPPAPLLLVLDPPRNEQRECVHQPAECPVVECPTWPMHKQVLAAKTETAKKDAYLAGAESVWWATESCERAAAAPCCSLAVEQVWDVEYKLSMLNLQVNMESVENHNWWRACRELLRVWPTEAAVEGNYPEDFPRYCR